jgi:MoaA/NifB/PqqE/SkfB family radical SAM enzyme
MVITNPTAHENISNQSTERPLTFLWLEITGLCNLSCAHCYAGSSPVGSRGEMKTEDWYTIIQDAADMGCKSIQFIGGEPTTHPDLNRLIRLARELEMRIEVYTNLVSVKDKHWKTFQECGVNIATSFYSSVRAVHEDITRGQHSFEKTVGNIKRTLEIGLPLRVGLIDMRDDQNIKETTNFLKSLGVERIRTDRTRSVGRGTELVSVTKPEDALCGACARGRAAVTPDGQVYPCVFSRHLTIGNVLHTPLPEIVRGEKMLRTRQGLQLFFIERYRSQGDPCIPADCAPDTSCIPDKPTHPASNCMPATEPYIKTQDLSSLQRWCPPHDCDPNCEPGECLPNNSCNPNHQCVPDWKDPCSPEKPCDPMSSPCTPDMACSPDK